MSKPMSKLDQIYVQTCKGRKFFPLVAEPDFDIEEIAQGLATQVRWHGQWKKDVEHYCVAQHSVLVSRLCSPRAKFWGLMHDGPEWLLGDIPSPLKHLFPDYLEQEALLDTKLRKAFSVPYDAEIAQEVHLIDKFVAQREADALLVDPSIVNGRGNVIALPGPAKLRIRPWSAAYSRAQFLLAFKVLHDVNQKHAV